jgi:ABC-type multidrug transport system ATPase subunit
VIALEGVAARLPPMALASLSAAWGAGAHAVVGTRGDGGPLVLAIVAGRAAVRAGAVRVLDGAPGDATVRPRVAYVPLDPSLPDAMRVHEVLALGAAVRGEAPRDPAARLAVLGVSPLATRLVRTLAPEEARAVALAEAVTSTRVRVLLVEEPLVGVDPRAVTRLPEVLRARAREGCAVLVATASLRDAGDLADDHLLLRRGAAAGRAASLGELAAFAPDGVRVRVVVSDPQALLSAVAREPAVEAVARRDAAVVARGRDAKALAGAVGRAIVTSGVEVSEMRIEPPSLEDARAASAGIAAATYEAAYARTRAERAPSPPPPAPGTEPMPPPEGTS